MGPREHPTAPVNEMRFTFRSISCTARPRLWKGHRAGDPCPNPLLGQRLSINWESCAERLKADTFCALSYFSMGEGRERVLVFFSEHCLPFESLGFSEPTPIPSPWSGRAHQSNPLRTICCLRPASCQDFFDGLSSLASLKIHHPTSTLVLSDALSLTRERVRVWVSENLSLQS